MLTRPTGRLLDLTRLVSRSGRVLTGVDRVELAYAERLLSEPEPLWALVKTAYGFLLLDATGVAAIAVASRSGDWGGPDLLSRLRPGLGRKRQAGQSLARAKAVARARPRNLSRMLASELPDGLVYLNLGHSNLDQRVMQAIKQGRNARITCMIHDTIPLDFPEYQREGSVPEFADKLRVAGAFADLILTPTDASAADIRRHLGDDGPPVMSIHLGVEIEVRNKDQSEPSSDPYFAMLGTIEPRKNHGLLLDVWEDMGDEAPRLIILGRRGWRNEDVFARLDAGIASVTERGDASDAEVRALLAGAAGMVFPSFAEGFGLPPVEAAALGVPVIASDLPVLREVLGPCAVYLNANDRYQWKKTIQAIAADPEAARQAVPEFDPPSWETHFKAALNVT